jgi:hypothetical protein
MDPAELTAAMGAALRRLLEQEGFDLPISFVALARNGSVLAGRYHLADSSGALSGEAGLDCDILAEAYVQGIFALPLNLMFVDARGKKAARVLIEGPDRESQWFFDKPSMN